MYDNVTEQYYLRARYYNPVIGRFTQEDEYRGDGLNLYAYCGNNPVMYVEPSGYGCKKTGGEGAETYQDAVDEAFNQIEAQTGYTRDQFEVTKWAKDVNGKSIPVEYLGPDNSYVDIDGAHFGVDADGIWASGPDAPHVGRQYGTKGKTVGHIILDSVPATRDGAYSDLLDKILPVASLLWPKEY